MKRIRPARWFRLVSALTLSLSAGVLAAQPRVVINEIHYHPVELPTFNADGLPALDLSDDIHEFVELHNFGATNVPLAGWQLSGDIDYDFPGAAVIAPGQFLVVAKDPARLAAIPEYNLRSTNLLGPYQRQLSNRGATVRLRDAGGDTVDAVSYSAEFPWAIGADGLGADDEWTGLNSASFQYRGRSLERVSVSWPANDPANWLASPALGNPSPGRSNAVTRAIPFPVVTSLSAVQNSDGAPIVRSNQAVRVDCRFSGTNGLSNVSLEYFIDDIESTNESRLTVAMVPVGAPAEGAFTAQLPGQSDRKIVRFRVRADRGAGVEVVSPRADDPFRWHAYFVTPVRSSPRPIYDCLISSASLNTLATNINQSPRRVTSPDPPGYPRESWNDTEPAVVAIDGVVFDVQMRHHGSRYRRDPSRRSYKWFFPRYAPFNGRTSWFITDKGDEHVAGHGLIAAAGLPTSRVRYVDLYMNSDPSLRRLEQEEMDADLASQWADEQQLANPGQPREAVGEFYKAQGLIPSEWAEGPYGVGNMQLLDPRPPWWSALNRYEWTYSLQMNNWKGHLPFQQMIEGLWDARGDTYSVPNPNIPALRAWLETHFDVDATLTYIALRNWMGPWDDVTHNYFLWRRANGKWGMLPWDFDSEFGGGQPATCSIFVDEVADPSNTAVRGPNFIKDSFFKAFREEYKQKLFILNNTLLAPSNITAMGFTPIRPYADARFISVNQQLGDGVFQRPLQPVHLAPTNGQGVLPPAILETSPYAHSASPAPAHATTTWIIRAANGTYAAPVFKIASATNLTSLPIPFDRLTLGQTYFWKCVYTDTNGHPSLESRETSFSFGASAAPGAVVLNEIMADNSSAVTNGHRTPDYIELLNVTDQPQALNGMSLSDNVLIPNKFVLPPAIVIPPRAFLTVWCDDDTNAPGLHAGFALDNDGQTVALFTITTNGYVVTDVLTFGLQAVNFSISRVPDASGSWRLSVPTPGLTNLSQPLASPTNLAVNEWMATDAGGPDWFELYNRAALPVDLTGLYLTDNLAVPTNTRVAPLSFIAPHGFQKFIADSDLAQGAQHVGFKLSGNGEAIGLFATNLAALDTVVFGPQSSGVSQGRLTDGGTNIVFFPTTPSPEAPNYLPIASVVINEVLSHSDPPLEDAVELFNPNLTNVDIGGWWLSDDRDELRKFRLPSGTVVPAGGFLVFYEYQFNDTNSPTSFSLNSAHGDEVYLSATDASGALTGYRTSVEFSAAESGVSLGRFATSQGTEFVALDERTFGADNPATVEEFRAGLGRSNASARVGPVVISEIQYHPPDLNLADNTRDEYVELINYGTEPAPLFDPAHPTNTWRLRDAVDFQFPTNVLLAPGEAALVVSFDPQTNAAALNEFRTTYALGAGVRLFGPYGGKLANNNDSVELVKPDSPVAEPGPDFGFVPSILVDRVRYTDRYPWPATADGTGQSLQRRVLSAYGNEPTNWFASGVSPGTVSFTNAVPSITLASPANGATFNATNRITVEANAVDADGAIRRVEFFAGGSKLGEAFSGPFRFTWQAPPLGSHSLTAKATDNLFGSATSAPVVIEVTNAPPTVALISPLPATGFVLPTNILLQATAADTDGTLERVELLADGVRLARFTNAPYAFVWTNARSGSHTLTARATDSFGLSSTSSPVVITATRERYIAYVVAAGTVGGQDYGGGLGMDFDVLHPIVVTSLGSFDSGGDGIDPSSSPTAQLFARSGSAGTVLATMTFSSATPGTLIESSRFRPLAAPLVLTNGSYTIVGYGHNSVNRNGNLCCGVKTWTTDDGGGLIAFVGSSRYGGSPGVLPGTIDVGPVDRYAAGTFEFVPAPELPTIFVQPTNVAVRVGSTALFSVGAAGRAPLSYQWWFESAPLGGQTNATLSLGSVQANSAGAYSVLVSNSLGSVTSAPALLAVLFDPVIVQQPLSQTVVAGADVTFSVTVTNNATLPIGYRWRRNGLFLSDAVFVLEERQCFFTVTNVQAPYTNYAVVTTNAARPSGLISAQANLTILADTDGDGLPDSWEQQFGLNAGSAADAALDADGDGALNWQEYLAGTDPTNALSCLKVDRLETGAPTTVLFRAVSNHTYTVEYTDRLRPPAWHKLAQVPARATNHMATVPDSEWVTNRFYRLVTPAQP